MALSEDRGRYERNAGPSSGCGRGRPQEITIVAVGAVGPSTYGTPSHGVPSGVAPGPVSSGPGLRSMTGRGSNVRYLSTVCGPHKSLVETTNEFE